MSLRLVICAQTLCISVLGACTGWGLYSFKTSIVHLCEGEEKYLVPSVNH